MTLGEWLDTWMELYVWPSDLAQNTKLCYNRAVKAVPAELRGSELHTLSPITIRRWLLDVAARHPRAAQLDRVMLMRALTLAYKAGEAPQRLSDPDLLPQVAHKAAKAAVLTREQLRAYLDAAAKEPAAVPLMLMACGLRRGEALGAKWECLDLAAGTLAVVGQRLPSGDYAPPKTAASVRTIVLPHQLKVVLQRMPRPIGGGWLCDIHSRSLYYAHARVLRSAQLPAVTLHGLRHSFATAAVQQGVPIKVLQAALGHSKYQLTADLYADHLPQVSTVPTRVFSA